MKPGKLQKGMLLLQFLRGHMVLTLHSQNTTAVVFQPIDWYKESSFTSTEILAHGIWYC